jgi:lysophospholipase L1-like esterase
MLNTWVNRIIGDIRLADAERKALILTMVLFACLPGCASSAPGPDPTVRIMCLGDSITAGYTDNPDWDVPFEFGYRSKLYSLLLEAGHNIQFVGESPEPWDGRWEVPVNTPAPDLRLMGQDKHRGYGGAYIEDLSLEIKDYIESDEPDVILLLIGINGIDANSPGQLDTLVERIFVSSPDVSLIVAQITPYTTFNQDLWDYNLHIRNTLVPAYQADGFSIASVDFYSLFLTDAEDPTSITLSGHSNKINHPTTTLYEQMAQSWFVKLEPVLESITVTP